MGVVQVGVVQVEDGYAEMALTYCQWERKLER